MIMCYFCKTTKGKFKLLDHRLLKIVNVRYPEATRTDPFCIVCYTGIKHLLRKSIERTRNRALLGHSVRSSDSACEATSATTTTTSSKSTSGSSGFLNYIPEIPEADRNVNKRARTEKMSPVQQQIISPQRRRVSLQQSPRRASPAQRQSPRQALPAQRQSPRQVSPVQRQSPRQVSPAQRQSPRQASPAQRQSPRQASPVQRQSPRQASPAQRQSPRQASPPPSQSPRREILEANEPSPAQEYERYYETDVSDDEEIIVTTGESNVPQPIIKRRRKRIIFPNDKDVPIYNRSHFGG